MIDSITIEGFEPITRWIIKKGKIKPESLHWEEAISWLYAFVVDEKELKYIGLTTRVLRSRLDDYSYITEEQCERMRALIMSELEKGRTVSIYGKKVEEGIDLFSEEARLRSELSPPWNRI